MNVITDDEDEVNNAGLLAIATERMAHFDRASTISQDEMNHILGIADADLAGFDEIELE